MTQKQYKRGPLRLLRCGVFAAMFAAAAAFACVWFLVTGDYDSISSEIGMLARVLLQLASAVGLAVLSRKMASEAAEKIRA